MKRFSFRELRAESRVFCAPLAGCTDWPFRKMMRLRGAGLMFCEMVKIDALIRNDPTTYRLLDYSSDMHPIGAQICGSKPAMAAAAARIIEELGFDVIDLNCGCPVDKVTKDGSGSGLLKKPELIGEILSAVIQAVRIPVTLKIRAGWDAETVCGARIAEMAERAGAMAIAVHGRTREQGYKGPANWDYIRDCKQAVKSMPVIGNGDILDPQSAKRCLEHTGCDGVLVARGMLGKPWIIEEIASSLRGEEPKPKGIPEVRECILQHFELIAGYQMERQALLDMRRVGCWYLRPCQGAKPLRMAINQAASTLEVFALLKNFDWEVLKLEETAAALELSSL